MAENIQVVNCCERRFCLACVKPPQEKPHQLQACPNCKDEDFDCMTMKKDNANIKDLKVYCREKKKGCKWMGKLKDLRDHLLKEEEGCLYSQRVCPKCQELIDRCGMVNHQENECLQRDYQCKHCNYEGSYDDVMRAHMPECTYCPQTCPNHCGVTCERANMDQHLDEICEEQYLPCEYEYAGCEDKFRRKNRDDHMSRYMNDHKMMMHVHKMVSKMMKKDEEEKEARKEEIRELRNRVDQLEDKVKQLGLKHHHSNQIDLRQATNGVDSVQIVDERKLHVLERSFTNVCVLPLNEPWTMTIDKFTERKHHQTMWESDIRQTRSGFKLQLNVWPNGKERGEGTHMAVWLGYRLDDADQRPQIPTTMTMTLKFKASYGIVLIKTENFRIEHIGRYRFNYIGTFNDNQLISHERLEKQNFIQNDSVVMHITLIEERQLYYNELSVAAENSLDSYLNSQLEGNFLEPYNPQVD